MLKTAACLFNFMLWSVAKFYLAGPFCTAMAACGAALQEPNTRTATCGWNNGDCAISFPTLPLPMGAQGSNQRRLRILAEVIAPLHYRQCLTCLGTVRGGAARPGPADRTPALRTAAPAACAALRPRAACLPTPAGPHRSPRRTPPRGVRPGRPLRCRHQLSHCSFAAAAGCPAGRLELG